MHSPFIGENRVYKITIEDFERVSYKTNKRDISL